MPDPPEPGPDEESVWEYPRPPIVEPTDRNVQVLFNDEVVADTTDAVRMLETSHPPVYYLPIEDVATEYLEQSTRTTMCEFKGWAVYFTVTVDDHTATEAAWGYPDPVDRYTVLTQRIAFYPSAMDVCYLDDEAVRHQDGDFYGGWITDDVVGPFKGGPDTAGW